MQALPLPRSFYERPAPELAPELLGCLLVCERGDQRLQGRIVEVEAYLGSEDAASHAYRGPTPRSRMMFGLAGHAYVYFIYGVHYCLNVVTGRDGSGEAVLIRAIEPVTGVDRMQQARGRDHLKLREFANGPGKLCQAMRIDKTMNGHDLTKGEGLWLEAREPGDAAGAEAISTSPRVGVRGDDFARTVAWRFFLSGNPCVSPTRLNRSRQG